MIGAVEASSTDIYEAVVALSRSIAGRSDLESLLSGVGESLRRIVRLRLRRDELCTIRTATRCRVIF